jgi:hypothetical protein
MWYQCPQPCPTTEATAAHFQCNSTHTDTWSSKPVTYLCCTRLPSQEALGAGVKGVAHIAHLVARGAGILLQWLALVVDLVQVRSMYSYGCYCV